MLFQSNRMPKKSRSTEWRVKTMLLHLEKVICREKFYEKRIPRHPRLAFIN